MPRLGMKVSALALGFAVTSAMGAIPEEGVHPDFTVSEVKMPGQYKTMGLVFMKDGHMALGVTDFVGWGELPTSASNKHKIFLVEGPGTPSPKVTEISHTWLQLSGLTVAENKLYATDRDGFYEIQELSPPTGTDLTKNRRLIVKWPDEGTWNVGGVQFHQWVFTPFYHQGSFYGPYCGVTREGGHSDINPTTKMAGALLKWGTDGGLEALAGGLRVANGAGLDENTGEIFVSDNQGGWFPASTFTRIRSGRFYGHRNKSPTTSANWAETLPYDPPAAWLPFKTLRVSPSQPALVPQGFYAGDWLLGDVASPGLVRISLDKVGDEFNGAVFWFSNGFSNAAINRMAWGPDGSLYIGTFMTIGANWPSGKLQPLFKLAPKATATAFEMKSIRSIKDGLEIEFTQPVDAATALKANFTARQWQYIRQLEYGTGKQPEQALSVSETAVSTDGRRVFLKLAGLVPDRVVYIKHTGVKSATGAAVWNDEAWFTHNYLSTREWSLGSSALKPKSSTNSQFAKNVVSRVLGQGILAVTLDVAGPWNASLIAPDGAVVASQSGQSSKRFELSTRAAQTGVYLLRVMLKEGLMGEEVVRKIVF
ncbi:MAG: hypothetical protein ABIW76_22835 [Fibrobacteria bacterium]